VRTTRRSSQRISRSEIWFGRQFYHWELKIENMASGLQLGTGRTRLIRFCLEMPTCLRSWMVSSFLWLSMASTSRNISRACGKANNKSQWNPSGCIIKGQHVELKSITSRNSVGSWYVAIASRDSEKSRCVAITPRNNNIKESRCVAITSSI